MPLCWGVNHIYTYLGHCHSPLIALLVALGISFEFQKLNLCLAVVSQAGSEKLSQMLCIMQVQLDYLTLSAM